jgi:hypothetical protein
MSIALDGFEVLRRIGKHAELFAPVRGEVDKQSRALVVKYLKTKSVGLDALREVREALGQELFALVIDGLKDTDIKSILTRLDKHHPDVKAGTMSWRRQHLNSLLDGASIPQAAPVKAKKTSAKKAKKADAEPPRLKSETVDIFSERGKKPR